MSALLFQVPLALSATAALAVGLASAGLAPSGTVHLDLGVLGGERVALVAVGLAGMLAFQFGKEVV